MNENVAFFCIDFLSIRKKKKQFQYLWKRKKNIQLIIEFVDFAIDVVQK